jgi:wyosine [tRNA(Phe)-imidazoG37] synthetase (radical SAM superfamily)
MDEVKEALASGPLPDVVTLTGFGEPTLSQSVGELIDQIKSITNIPVAVLTNGSLLWRKDVIDELLLADIVAPSLDAGDNAAFHFVNRPAPELNFDQMVEGVTDFSHKYQGKLWLEVFLVSGITSVNEQVLKISALTALIKKDVLHLNSIRRPPAESYAHSITDEQMQRLAKWFESPVQIVAALEHEDCAKAEHQQLDEVQILALLKRRPSTLAEVAETTGAHPLFVGKALELLCEQKKLKSVKRDAGVYYSAVEFV